MNNIWILGPSPNIHSNPIAHFSNFCGCILAAGFVKFNTVNTEQYVS